MSHLTQQCTSSVSGGICGIYALCCPDTNRVMYIGQSKDIKKRYGQHCSLSNNLSGREVSTWIRSLLRRGLKPLITVLEETPDLDAAESRHIKIYGQDNLLNMTGGGDSMVALRRAKADMPWGKKQAPIQKALIRIRREANLRGSARLSKKADAVQAKVAKLKQDKATWVAANLYFAMKNPAFKTWDGLIQVGDGWY